MRRILQAPCAIFCFNLQENFTFPLFICFLISACSLPPKPRLNNKQIEPQRPQSLLAPPLCRRPAINRGTINFSPNLHLNFFGCKLFVIGDWLCVFGFGK